ncbi:WD40-repeat-containing domain protein [Lineolata rhizophorae]|uniref:Serine-threonine kinase receptor-associated protein n=1 Tax=Lineolata rhizophorae TaxID=578093 RepID=A0A6A6NQV5_9PEZI|nr:WD40-repeat-containing domain protein [Lineolata rhizophorae]
MAVETTKVVPLTCHGHSRPVTHLSFSFLDDASSAAAAAENPTYYLISACKDNNPMLRDGVTGDWIGTFIGHKGAVWQARLSSDASLAATGSADFSAKVWDTHSGEGLCTLAHNHIVRAVAFPPSVGRPTTLATGGPEKKLRVFDLSRATAAAAAPSTPNGVTADGSTASSPTAGGGSGGNGAAPAAAGVTNAATDAAVAQSAYEVGAGTHGGTIKSIVWADDNVLVTAADDKKVRWWDLRARRAVADFAVDGTVGSCELNAVESGPPGTLSVAAGKSAYFFDGAAPARLVKKVDCVSGGSGEVASVAMHPGGKKFVTGATGDTWVRVWDFDEEKEIEIGKGHHGPIWSVSFSPDGKIYATGSEDGTIKLWKFTTGPYGLWR